MIACVVAFVVTYRNTTTNEKYTKIYGSKLENSDVSLSRATNELKLTNSISKNLFIDEKKHEDSND